MPAKKMDPQIPALMDEAFEYLDNHKWKRAIKTGRKLLDLRHSSGFEILARAYAAQGKPKKTRQILQEAVELAPKVWILWELLGVACSDAGRYEEGAKAFQSALECPAANADSIHFNWAIMLDRQDRKAEAILLLRKIPNASPGWFRARSLLAVFLSELGENKKALTMAETVWKQFAAVEDEDLWDNPERSGTTFWQLANVLWRLGGNKERSLECARRSVEFERGDERFLALIREIEEQYSGKAKYYRLLVQGDWPEPIETKSGKTRQAGFLSSYDIVADNKEEALQLLKPLEPSEIRETLKIAESEVLQKKVKDLKGVYRMDIYNVFPYKKSGQ